MTLEQLRKFADSSEGHIRQIALTREAARQIIAEHDRECAMNAEQGFEIDTRKHNGPLDAALTLARFKRMHAEDGL